MPLSVVYRLYNNEIVKIVFEKAIGFVWWGYLPSECQCAS